MSNPFLHKSHYSLMALALHVYHKLIHWVSVKKQTNTPYGWVAGLMEAALAGNQSLFFWVKSLYLMVCVKAINVWRLATLQSYLNVPVSPWGVGEGSGGRRGPAAAQHLDTWELFARLQSLTNYAKHCGVKAASPLHLSPQICNVNSVYCFWVWD